MKRIFLLTALATFSWKAFATEKDLIKSILDVFKEYNFNVKVEAGNNYNALEKV